MNTKDKTLTIIGAGRLGGALALALSRNGYVIESLFARNDENAKLLVKSFRNAPKVVTGADYSQIDSEIVLIATQDSEIEFVAEKLSENLRNTPILLHTSGSQSSQILHKSRDFIAGSIHPLVSISDSIAGSEKFSGVFFGIEGHELAIQTATKIAEDLGGKPFQINSESKALYHAAAVMACGHIVALIDASNELMSLCGVDDAQAENVLMPLIKSTISNLEVQNASEALTGTFARLDVETFERHLGAMKGKVPDEIIELYLQLGLRSLHLVKSNESNIKQRNKLLEKISLAKRNLKC